MTKHAYLVGYHGIIDSIILYDTEVPTGLFKSKLMSCFNIQLIELRDFFVQYPEHSLATGPPITETVTTHSLAPTLNNQL